MKTEVGSRKSDIGIKGNMHTVGISVPGNILKILKTLEKVEYRIRENNFTVGILVLEI